MRVGCVKEIQRKSTLVRSFAKARCRLSGHGCPVQQPSGVREGAVCPNLAVQEQLEVLVRPRSVAERQLDTSAAELGKILSESRDAAQLVLRHVMQVTQHCRLRAKRTASVERHTSAGEVAETDSGGHRCRVVDVREELRAAPVFSRRRQYTEERGSGGRWYSKHVETQFRPKNRRQASFDVAPQCTWRCCIETRKGEVRGPKRRFGTPPPRSAEHMPLECRLEVAQHVVYADYGSGVLCWAHVEDVVLPCTTAPR
mmetsp:Transcript_73439/g.203970  ORF Transcript_73439/g.203970 Transcript_73439/m.203970 type:complete len:256 (-) Transcript_73439:247-1014(-)